MDSPRLRPELDDVTRRIAAMPLVDQLELATRLEQLVNLDQPVVHDEAAKRKETLECLRRAAEHLGVERPLTKSEYERVQKELRLAWSWQQILRLWGSFQAAAAAAAGGRMPQTWQQRDFRRRFVRPRTGGIEESLNAVRAWLATKPATETRQSYDQFARQHNLAVPDGDLPLPRASLLTNRLGLPFGVTLAAAKGETPLPEAQAHARDNNDWSEGPDDLIAIGTIALLTGKDRNATRLITLDWRFPRPVLTFRRLQVWLRAEVEAFLDGVPAEPAPLNRLQERYLGSAEVAKLLCMSLKTLNLHNPTPLRPVAKVGNMNLWLREEVEAYLATDHARITLRRRQRAKLGSGEAKKMSEFVTLSGFAHEVGMKVPQARLVFAEPGFPAAVAWFGASGIWLRAEVEQHLLGNAVPSRPVGALQGLLMTSEQLREYLAYSRAAQRRSRMDVPPPAAVTEAGNIYLRSDVEAHLDADPGRRELLAARRARRQSGEPD